jgi:hypothetical protein
MEPRQPGKIEVLATLLTTLLAVWWMMPPQDREWAKLRVLHLAHRVSAKLARQEGHRGMGDELAGRDLARYPVAYLLSQARDRVAAALEQMRP